MAPQINPSEALRLYQSGKSLREIASILGIAHPMTVQRVLKRESALYVPCQPFIPRPLQRAQRELKHAESKVAYWKQRVEELQKAAV